MIKNDSNDKISTLEDMRDALNSKTNDDVSKETVGNVSDDVELKPEDFEELETEVSEADQLDITKDFEIAKKKENYQKKIHEFTLEEKREKFEKFMSHNTNGNIYSDSAGTRGPTTFHTGEFVNKNIDKEKLTSFERHKITESQIDRFNTFQKQRNKKVEKFNNNYKVIHGAEIRPLYGDSNVSDEDATDSNKLVDKPDVNLEYRDKADFRNVNNYLIQTIKKLRLSTLLLAILFVISLIWQLGVFNYFALPAYLTVAKPLTYLSLNLLFLVCSSVVLLDVLKSGIIGLLKLKANANSAISVMIVGNIFQNLLLFFSGNEMINNKNIFLLTPVVIGCMTFHSLANYVNYKSIFKNFKFICDENLKCCSVGMATNEDLLSVFSKGRSGKLVPLIAFKRKVGFLTDFIYYSVADNITDTVGFFLAPIGLCLSVLLAIISEVVSKNIWISLTVFSATLCLVTPFSFLFSAIFPFYSAQRRLSKKNSALLGSGAINFGNTDTILLNARELFPKGTVSLAGIRVFNGYKIDDSIICAASVLNASDSILKDMFMDILLGNEKHLKKVDTILYEDGLGISAWVDDRRVIIGSYDMMINHNVVMPSYDEISQMNKNNCEIIFVAISGQLTAAFMYNMGVDYDVELTLKSLEDEGISLIIKSVDFVIQYKKLSEKFEVCEDLFKVLPAQYHKSYRKQTREIQRDGSSVICNDDFASFANAIIESKKYRFFSKVGMAFSIFGILVSVLILVLFIATNMVYRFSSLGIIAIHLSVLLVVFCMSLIGKRQL